MRILLIACYELGHQPLSLAWPLAFLKRAGFEAEALDLSVQTLDEAVLRQADFIGVAAPMHTALRLGARIAERVRALNPHAHLCFYGLYAQLNAQLLFDRKLADSVIAGEAEAALVELVRALSAGEDWRRIRGVMTAGAAPAPVLTRLSFPTPERASLPPLTRYARYVSDSLTPALSHGEREWRVREELAGYVEASRGCLHTCTHCPIVPIYNGRFFVVPAEVVLADIEQQVAAGARHITFGDPDFLNGPKHALRLARELHARWPALTFDFTTKVEHILQHRALFPEFAQLGATFVVSAIESVSDHVLQRLRKGHTAADIEAALEILDDAGLALQPTFVAFTPWTTLEDYLAQLEFIRKHGLIQHVPPVQFAIRLLLPPGSPLVHAPDAAAWLGELDAEAFGYRWSHPDPRMDALYVQVAARVAEAQACNEPFAATFEAVCRLAYRMAGRTPPSDVPSAQRPSPPRLTEDWFC
ncbi:MAG: CUAEP/CCAEP-tail radical SAM protein [Anaerolineales bacterium]|nr:CUAEP/CCAEP-tail radical SAM protein [Anaerolineales bacterium]